MSRSVEAGPGLVAAVLKGAAPAGRRGTPIVRRVDGDTEGVLMRDRRPKAATRHVRIRRPNPDRGTR